MNVESIKINSKSIANINSKDDLNIIGNEFKYVKKILKFSYSLKLEEILDIINSLNSFHYCNLFIFCFDRMNDDLSHEKNETNFQKIQKSLLKFDNSRPIILQFKFLNNEPTKLYIKEQNIKEFKINEFQNFDTILNLQTCMRIFFNTTENNFQENVLKSFSNIKNRSLILKLLRIFTVDENFIENVVIKVSQSGTRFDLFCALDMPFGSNGQILSTEAEKLLKTKISCEIDLNDFNQKNPELPKTNVLSALNFQHFNDFDIDENDSDSEEEVFEDCDSTYYSSVVLTATEKRNHDVCDFMVNVCTSLIQQLPHEHQVQISTAAFETMQFDYLCDLVKVSDFPFPNNFIISKVPESSKRLHKLVDERNDLFNFINENKLHKIDEFIKENMSLKVVYSPKNTSAMKYAVDAKNYKVFYHLKAIGFYPTEFDNLENYINSDELKLARKYETKQRNKNVKISRYSIHSAVMTLCSRSKIYNSKTNEEFYRQKISMWYDDIYKIVPIIIDVAASWEILKIIFDFESNYVSINF